MDRPQPQTSSFDPDPTCVGAARRWVTSLLDDWGLPALADDAALCAVELATNAILHTRARFVVTVRPSGPGVRLDVLDTEPARLPVTVPAGVPSQGGTGTTGRGLQIVAALSSRWGVSTSEETKVVWVELGDGPATEPNEPVLDLARPADPSTAGRTLHLVDMPVRTAVASGMLLDDAVREMQLGALPSRIRHDDRARLLALVAASAGPRLAGRHAALLAAADGRDRFDIDVAVDAPAFFATAEVTPLLAELVPGLTPSPGDVTARVVALRSWVVEETARQLGGAEPTPCPLEP